jgi:hypothetical protein
MPDLNVRYRRGAQRLEFNLATDGDGDAAMPSRFISRSTASPIIPLRLRNAFLAGQRAVFEEVTS